jgi:hypothetical protein
MSEKSPLFNSAVELLAHSIELFTQGKEEKQQSDASYMDSFY